MMLCAGLSEAMLRGGSWQLGEKGTHYIKTIKNSSHHLANIINDILDAAAFSKGRLVIKREKVRLSLPSHCTSCSVYAVQHTRPFMHSGLCTLLGPAGQRLKSNRTIR